MYSDAIASDLLPFEHSEFKAKLDFLQLRLTGANLAGALIFDPENIFWATGYRSIGYFTFQALFVPVRGAPTLISRIVNQRLASALPTIGTFIPVPDFADPMSILAKFIDDTVAPTFLVGLETDSTYLSIKQYRSLQDLVHVKLVDWDGVIEEQRKVKTPEQLKRMRAAAKAAVDGLEAAVISIVPGRTENDVAAAMLAGAVSGGSEYFRVPLVVTGPATALCFTTWQRRRIERGHVVLLESAACVDRYHAVIGRTVIVGRAKPEHRRVADALLQTLDAAIAAIRPGVTIDSVYRAGHRVLDATGFSDAMPYRLGYSVGIAFPPNWAEGHFLDLKAGDHMQLLPGMTFHVIPSIFTTGFGMWFSETVAVTNSGVEPLTNYPRKLIELDA
jgi:Xaa-Pro aminopeptidase